MSRQDDPYRPFRPRATRVIIPILLVACIAGSAAIIVRLVQFSGDYSAQILSVVLVLALVVSFLLRVLAIRAVPDTEGLRVYNIVLRHHLPWQRIVSVHFGDRSWVQLDIADGTTLSVMAVQRADGTYARQEAARLSALVTAAEGVGEDPGHRRGQE
ncbi:MULTISPECIES: PH domain-containing protein [unclassified Pseudactinotalea]|uniref:PH domain-containing protein n=1 Tax=unclassified Pseudactinotalea TaxID=2649176 RepID=UPI003C7A39EF